MPINKSLSKETNSEYTTGNKKCPKALLTPSNVRTDSSPGSLGKVHAHRKLQTDSLWDFGRKDGALTTFKVKEGRIVD